MALIHYYKRNGGGEYDKESISKYSSPAEFVIDNIADGVPFRCLLGGVDIGQDVDAMLLDGEYHIIESAGEAVLNPFSSFNDPLGINRKIRDAILPQPEEVNQQSTSANNSLTNRDNKPRPYARVYDICGTVQSIPSNLMEDYNVYIGNKQYQYGYYYIARGFADTPESGILDGDTLYSTITGSSANIYDPFTSPNNSLPRQIVGEQINESLYITQKAENVDGTELKAPNEYELKLIDEVVNCQLSGTVGALVNATGQLGFDDLFQNGQEIILSNVISGLANLDGEYTILAVSDTSISFEVGALLPNWQLIPGGAADMNPNANAKVTPKDIDEAGFTDWVAITTIKPERLIANIVARQGMYRVKSGQSETKESSATAELEWQALDENNDPIGAITPVSATLQDKTRDEVGVTIFVTLPTPSAVRVRVRRSSNLDLDFDGQIVDSITFVDLFGQIEDDTPQYGDLTTIHTVRKSTPQATSNKSAQLKVLATEQLFKYLGNGVFDTVRTNNTQAVQSLIRLMRDPIIGNLTMSNASMDKLLSVQSEIETYFGDTGAGEFSYTFDESKTTAQEIAQAIAQVIFCDIYRAGNDIQLFFEKPVSGPSMVFTHRSKIGEEKWTRTFGSEERDSVEFTWIDPNTNIRETIRIPENGGINPNKIESKGVRNYKQAYWLAHRARQRDLLQRVRVEFNATEEGVYVKAGEPISVVKGSRVSTQDGYVVAVNGFTLTLSQEVSFTAGDDHSVILKRRDGTAESINVVAGSNARTVTMLSLPSENIYTANSALKTEFSFGNEARHMSQMIIPITIDPQTNKSVKITGNNYHPDLYLFDSVNP